MLSPLDKLVLELLAVVWKVFSCLRKLIVTPNLRVCMWSALLNKSYRTLLQCSDVNPEFAGAGEEGRGGAGRRY